MTEYITQLKPIDKIFPEILQAFNKWLEENNSEKLERDIFNRLNKSKDEILLKLLGFNTSWTQKWELDHCNGRAGNSTAGDYLKNTQGEVIKKWLKSVSMPELTKLAQNVLKNEINREYQRYFRESALKLVREQAHSDASLLINSLVQSDCRENYDKVLALLNPKPTE